MTTTFLRVALSWHALAVAALVALGCSDSSGPDVWPCPQPPFNLSPALDTLTVGATRLFSTGTSGRVFRWSTSNSTIAEVDQAGLATARAPGRVGVAAFDEASAPHCPNEWVATLVVR